MYLKVSEFFIIGQIILKKFQKCKISTYLGLLRLVETKIDRFFFISTRSGSEILDF